MHKDILKFYMKHEHENLPDRNGYYFAAAAPRGFAKSTIISLILPIHAILYKKEKYIIIISATLKQARQRLKNIKTELLTNKALKSIFGDLSQNKKKWNASSINLNDIQIDVYSAGTEIRGINIGDYRPTKIILDDVELSEGSENSETREKLLEWFSEVVENLGDKYTRLEIIGTILHKDSLLSSLLQRPDFKSYRYKAVENFSNASSLWKTWQKKIANLNDKDREKNAYHFFLQNKEAMLANTKVLWEAKEDYYSLMIQQAVRGKRAFFKEKQNEPIISNFRIFNPEFFKFFTLDEYDNIKVLEDENIKNEMEIINVEQNNLINKADLLFKNKMICINDLRIFGFLDSAMGNKGGVRKGVGDYAAIVTIGTDPLGHIYVLNVWLERASPTKQIEKIFSLYQKYDYISFGIETNCFQQLLMIPIEEERKQRRENNENWELKITEVLHKANKETRIASLEPLITNGWMLFNKDLQKVFFEQLEEFPKNVHDDGPDALEAAVSIANQKKSFAGLDFGKLENRKTKSTTKLF